MKFNRVKTLKLIVAYMIFTFSKNFLLSAVNNTCKMRTYSDSKLSNFKVIFDFQNFIPTGGVPKKSDGAIVEPDNAHGECVAFNGATGSGAVVNFNYLSDNFY